MAETVTASLAEATHESGGSHTINILTGSNPIEFNTAKCARSLHFYLLLAPADHLPPHSPLLLVIVQLILILALSRALAFAFAPLRVPRVVCEIVAGILLGPTAFGQIPGFTENIFPPESIPFLQTLSGLGLVLFLFVVGTDVDFGLLRRAVKPTLAVSTAGLILPFALGCAVSRGLYGAFSSSDVTYTTFMVFIGTSMSITAFPVLARIVGDLRLNQDPVGLVVLASGVVNDVLGWCLLSLAIALSSAGSGVVVVYIMLCLVGLCVDLPLNISQPYALTPFESPQVALPLLRLSPGPQLARSSHGLVQSPGRADTGLCLRRSRPCPHLGVVRPGHRLERDLWRCVHASFLPRSALADLLERVSSPIGQASSSA